MAQVNTEDIIKKLQEHLENYMDDSEEWAELENGYQNGIEGAIKVISEMNSKK